MFLFEVGGWAIQRFSKMYFTEYVAVSFSVMFVLFTFSGFYSQLAQKKRKWLPSESENFWGPVTGLILFSSAFWPVAIWLGLLFLHAVMIGIATFGAVYIGKLLGGWRPAPKTSKAQLAEVEEEDKYTVPKNVRAKVKANTRSKSYASSLNSREDWWE